MTTPRIEAFAAFLAARHSIYLARKAGKPYPWTTDPVLSSGHFCNVFRELDRVTIWVRKNIREPFADHPNLWIMLALARYINWPPTLQALMDYNSWPSRATWHPSDVTASLEHLASKGEKVYTGAYMIRAESDPKKEWYSWTKHRYIAEVVIGRLWEDRETWTTHLSGENHAPGGLTLESVWERFQQPRYVGWGPFMAYEVVTDMRHTRYLRNAPDIYHWANAGPGAIRGLNRLYGRELKAQPPKAQTNGEMRRLMLELNDIQDGWCAGCSPETCLGCGVGLGNAFSNTFGPKPRELIAGGGQLDRPNRFEMRDIEHSLCEFDKYERVSRQEGQMRSHYDPRRSYPLD